MDGIVIAPWWFRVVIWLLIVGAGMVAACPSLAGIYLIPFYPLGLVLLFGGNPGWVIATLGYLAHVVLFAAMLRYRKLGTFTIACSLLILVCTVTSFGCRKALASVHLP